jgi:hypothetical protein
MYCFKAEEIFYPCLPLTDSISANLGLLVPGNFFSSHKTQLSHSHTVFCTHTLDLLFDFWLFLIIIVFYFLFLVKTLEIFWCFVKWLGCIRRNKQNWNTKYKNWGATERLVVCSNQLICSPYTLALRWDHAALLHASYRHQNPKEPSFFFTISSIWNFFCGFPDFEQIQSGCIF